MYYLPDTFLDLLLIIGGLNGIILGIVLFVLKRNRLANTLLAILTICWSLSAIARSYQGSELYQVYPHLLKVFSVVALFWYPLVYLYVKYLIKAINKFRLLDLLHFIPAAIRIIVAIPYYSMPAAEKLAIYNGEISGFSFYNYLDQFVDYTIIIQGIIYTFLAVRLMSNYERKLKTYFSNIDRIVLTWLRTIIILNIFCLCFGISATIASGFFQFDVAILWDLLYIVLISTIYLIAVKSFKFPELFDYVSKIEEEDSSDSITAFVGELSSKVSSEEYMKLKNYLEEEKPYLDPELSLQSLANSLGMTRHQLSYIINSDYNKSFYDLMHEYRVSEIMDQLSSPASKNYTLESIAYTAGFNSKATFNRVFKKVTGKTPSTFINEFDKN